jgi:hypothetical protein
MTAESASRRSGPKAKMNRIKGLLAKAPLPGVAG